MVVRPISRTGGLGGILCTTHSKVTARAGMLLLKTICIMFRFKLSILAKLQPTVFPGSL